MNLLSLWRLAKRATNITSNDALSTYASKYVKRIHSVFILVFINYSKHMVSKYLKLSENETNVTFEGQ